LALIALVLALLSGDEIVVPDVIGLSLEEAADQIEDADLVVEQDPPARTEVERGATIEIEVSRGPEEVAPEPEPEPDPNPNPSRDRSRIPGRSVR